METISAFARVVAALLILPSMALAQATDPLPSWNDGPTKAAILEFVKATTDTANPKFVAARGTHRDIRSGRHDLGRAADVHAGHVLPRTRAGGGGEEPELKSHRSLQDRALR